MGIAPLVFLASALCPRPIEILMGGRTLQEMFWADIFSELCQKVHITTDDGTLGTRGFTLDMLPQVLEKGHYDMIYTCGPEVMMRGVAKLAQQFTVPCQVSLEEHMACGVGACLSCTCQASDGKRRKICSDGPVFWSEEVFW
jgi:dihydroorotate dehydrogenase electron transfer subunit